MRTAIHNPFFGAFPKRGFRISTAVLSSLLIAAAHSPDWIANVIGGLLIGALVSAVGAIVWMLLAAAIAESRIRRLSGRAITALLSCAIVLATLVMPGGVYSLGSTGGVILWLVPIVGLPLVVQWYRLHYRQR